MDPLGTIVVHDEYCVTGFLSFLLHSKGDVRGASPFENLPQRLMTHSGAVSAFDNQDCPNLNPGWSPRTPEALKTQHRALHALLCVPGLDSPFMSSGPCQPQW